MRLVSIRFAAYALAGVAAVMACGAAAAAPVPFRCTDDVGLVLLTSDPGTARICKLLAKPAGGCAGETCGFRITRDPDGRLYIDGTANGTRVHYPVDSGANAVTICIRNQCKAQ